MRAILYALLLLPAMQVVADGPQIEFASGDRQVALVELYTSEGCSSCPPADRWLRELKADDGLWHDYVPVAFHVDYWDSIGWKDRFASRKYSDRQRRYAAEGGVRVVYTPGMFLNGKEWRGWQRTDVPSADRRPAGKLGLTVDGNRARIRFEYAGGGDLVAHFARLGMNLETEVRAGENRGRKLLHDFVVLDLVTIPLTQHGGGYEAVVPFPEGGEDAPRTALAAWVSRRDRQAPLQAIGGLLQEK